MAHVDAATPPCSGPSSVTGSPSAADRRATPSADGTLARWARLASAQLVTATHARARAGMLRAQ